MFEDTTSAGTVVAAILEGAGFYTHAAILDTFSDFFDAGGELLFIASCCLGLLLTVLYGGYRPALALIIGPSLFYFLVGYRVAIDAPIKQLGGGDPVEVSQGLNLSLNQPEDKKLEPARISWFLAITAKLSSAVTKTVTDLILEKEQEEELLFLTQEGALTAIIGAEPSRSELQSMLSFTILNDCAPLLSSIYQLSSAEYSSEHDARLSELASPPISDRNATISLAQLDSRRLYWDQLFVQWSKVKVKPSQPMKDFIKRETSIFVNTGEGRNYAQKYGKVSPNDPAKFISDELTHLSLTCGQAMDVFGDAALVQGDWVARFVSSGTLEQSLRDTPENRDLLCKTISEKMFGVPSEVEPCQLGSIAMLYVIRNLFSSTALNQASQSIINRSNTTDTSLSDRCRNPDHEADLDELCATIDITSPSPISKAINDGNAISAENLKESIVSYALNIPYYQGLLIYFLATVFPFWAMLVIVPGRGGTFLYLPLAWCWIKSWDIGFALVYILDRLLWNLLPTPRLLESGYTHYGDLPTLLRGLAGVDLGGDIHAHYYFVGMCMLAVPVISGYAFLRGRGEVLSIIYRAPGVSAGFDKGHFSQTQYNEERNIGELRPQEKPNERIETGAKNPAIAGPADGSSP